jgi:nucleoside phosphorylase
MDTNDDDIVIHPVRLKRESAVPETGLLLVNPSEARYGMETALAAGWQMRTLYNSNLCVNESLGCFIAGPAIGAPMAVMTMEKLIALGARRIFLFGWCGSMRDSLGIGDLLLPNRALSGEGTSSYYDVSGRRPASSPILLELLKKLLKRYSMPWLEGCVWSTDAPYREKRSALRKLQQEEDVSAVDMEYSALCSAAFFRKIDFAALLLVSDEVWDTNWNPGFSRQEFRTRSRKLIDIFLHELPLTKINE